MAETVLNQEEMLFRYADQIPAPLWDDLQQRPVKDAAIAVGAEHQDGIFNVPLLGLTYQVDPGARQITRKEHPAHRVSYQTAVVLLTALSKSLGVPPSGRMVTPLELEGGTLFFTGAHSLATKPLSKHFGSAPQTLVNIARTLGGEPFSAADCAVKIPGLPLLPLYVLLWTADSEFSARTVIGIDDRALFHLDLAAIFALTNVMVSRLINRKKEAQ